MRGVLGRGTWLAVPQLHVGMLQGSEEASCWLWDGTPVQRGSLQRWPSSAGAGW